MKLSPTGAKNVRIGFNPIIIKESMIEAAKDGIAAQASLRCDCLDAAFLRRILSDFVDNDVEANLDRCPDMR